MKLKLKSSARIKKHHLLIEGTKAEVEKAILDYLGILGWAKASPSFVQRSLNKSICETFSFKNRKVSLVQTSRQRILQNSLQTAPKIILSVERKSVTNVRAAFEASPYKIKVIKVSGTLKGLIKDQEKRIW